METNQNCVNAKLVRFEFGASADVPGMLSDFPTPYYFAFVFMKGGLEHKEVFPSSNVGQALELTYLQYIGQILERKKKYNGTIIYYFSGGDTIRFT